MGKRINYVTRDMLSRLSKRLFRRCQLLEKWMLSWKKRAEELEIDLNKYDELGCAMSKRFVDVYKNNLELWKLNQELADETFSETVDYLNVRELIKNIDYFYSDPLNKYIPITSAILIANMYAKRLPAKDIELYILSTRRWINDLALNLDTLDYTKLLDQKVLKQMDEESNQYE